MRVAVVLVVASAFLAVGQSASLGEVKKLNEKESKSPAMREILREIIDELSTAEKQSGAVSVPKDTNHAPYFDPDTYTQFIETYTDVKPGDRIGYVRAYDDDTWDKVTFTLLKNLDRYGQAGEYFDLKTVKNDAASGKHKDDRYPYSCEIYLKKPFDDSEKKFSFMIEARDNGTMYAIKHVEIHVKKRVCLPGYTYDEEFDGCLKLVTDHAANFSEAQAHCEQDKKEGNIFYRPFLAHPRNRWQNDKIAHLVKALEQPVWIGAKFDACQKLWFWRNFGGTIEDGFSNWREGEPYENNPDQWDRCAAMVGAEASTPETAGQWVDLSCYAKLPFVCEHYKFKGSHHC